MESKSQPWPMGVCTGKGGHEAGGLSPCRVKNHLRGEMMNQDWSPSHLTGAKFGLPIQSPSEKETKNLPLSSTFSSHTGGWGRETGEIKF